MGLKWCKVHRDVWFDPKVRAHPRDVRDVLMDLTVLAEPDGSVKVTREELSTISGVSPGRLQEILDTLSKWDLVKASGDGLMVASILADLTYTNNRRKGGLARQRQNAARAEAQGEAGAEGRAASASASTSSSDKRESVEREIAAKMVIPESLRTPAFEEAWRLWCDHRRGLKKPLSPATEATQLKKLACEGSRPATERIMRSIENGWRGLWFKDEEFGQPKAPPANPYRPLP